jgi:hypothetical protein
MPIGTALAIAGGVAAVGKGVASGVAAGKAKREAERQQDRAVRLAKATPQELKLIESNTRDAEIALNRERKVLEAIDPALIDAGQQAYKMLQGKEAAILAPLNRARARQRTVLEENLRRQLGPGFETSSSGIEALTKFDTQSQDIYTQAQQGAIMQLLGSAQQTRGMAATGEFNALSAQRASSAMIGNIRSRQIGAITGTAPGMINTAGGMASAVAGGFGAVGQLAGFAAMAGAGGAANATKPMDVLSSESGHAGSGFTDMSSIA